MVSMSADEQTLFHELIVVASKLATVADNFAVSLSEHFEEGVRKEVDDVRAVLARCPQPKGVWDGELRDEDCTIQTYMVPMQRGSEPRGVKIRHTITGISRDSNSKATQAENREVATKALEVAVAERYQSMQR